MDGRSGMRKTVFSVATEDVDEKNWSQTKSIVKVSKKTHFI